MDQDIAGAALPPECRRAKKALAVLRAGVSALLAGTLPPSTTQPDP